MADGLPIDETLIDQIADAFDRAWQDGDRPLIEVRLGEVSETARTQLLIELVRIELEVRREAAEDPTIAEYLARFPEHAEAIVSAFERTTLVMVPSGDGLAAPEDRVTLQNPGVVVLEDPADAQANGDASTLDMPLGSSTFPCSLKPWAGRGWIGRRIGPFLLTRLIAEGGMGSVFRAEQFLPVRRSVALKLIKPGQGSDQVLARFEAERQALALMDHPHIARIFEAGATDDGHPYFAMELVDGAPITTFCDRHRLGLDDRLDLIVRVARAIHHAHLKGMIHRDVKPSNVLVARVDDELVPKVIDFGIAKAVDRQQIHSPYQTEVGYPVGTLAYMSPEQARRGVVPIDVRADVYALGAMLYDLLTGTIPLEVNTGHPDVGLDYASLLEALRMIREDDPPAPSVRLSRDDPAGERLRDLAEQRATDPQRLIRRVRGELDWIVMKALEKDPNRRYESARDLADDLQRLRVGEPIDAGPPSTLYRLRKRALRHRIPLAIATSMAIALAVAILSLVATVVQRRAMASGFVAQMATARIDAVPGILAQMGDDRRFVGEQLARQAERDGSISLQVRAALTQLPDDPNVAESLIDRLLDPIARPLEVLVIRDVLRQEGQLARFADQIEAELPEPDPPSVIGERQLHALAALAVLDPADRPWRPTLREPLAAALAQQNALLIGDWRRIFQPVARSLVEPLHAVYADRAGPEARDHAFALLLAFGVHPDNDERPEDLADLIVEAAPDQLEQILTALEDAPEDRQRVTALLEPLLTPVARFDVPRAQRQGRVAAALLRLDVEDPVWPLFSFRADPSIRTELIRNLRDYRVDPLRIVGRLRVVEEPDQRYALLLALSNYDAEAIPEAERTTLRDAWLEAYRTDSNAAVHGALTRILKDWGEGERLDAIDRELASIELPANHQWYVNSLGQTFTIVRGPVEFLMGSTPESDPDRKSSEHRHTRRIPRSFAAAVRETTVEEWVRFLDEVLPTLPKNYVFLNDFRGKSRFRENIPTDDCPVGCVSLFAAMHYCNWLSQREGIPEDQWCYNTKILGTGLMTLPEDLLEREGYRLPTEAEREYLQRAGTLSAWPIGNNPDRLADYAWYLENSGRVMHPVVQLKPNDLGLFDLLGNAHEWCTTATRGSVIDEAQRGQLVVDLLRDAIDLRRIGFRQDIAWVVRGGSYLTGPSSLRSSFHYYRPPITATYSLGLRVVRTIRD